MLFKFHPLQRTNKLIVLQFTDSDTGIGIPKDKLNTISQEFSQASYDIDLEYGGTGLGHTITQKLLQMYGSELQVSSEEGKGSEFSFPLSFKSSTQTSSEKGNKSRLKEFLANSESNILVVDDSQVNLLLPHSILEAGGLQIKQ